MRYKKTGKKILTMVLCAFLGTSLVVSPLMDSMAAYEKTDGSYKMPDGTAIEEVLARGIDVSRWQGEIDWAAVANDDVSFVMLGTRSKGDVDPYFHANVKNAAAAGLKVGAYIYSLATTVDMAIAEADFVLNLVKDYPISFPIAFDAEDSATLGALPPDQVSEIIKAFCERIAKAGYYPILYANDNWLANKIDLSSLDYDVWVARYEAKHKYANPILWQATSSGSIKGINGKVDIDFLYKDLSPKLPGSLWRTIGEKKYYYQNYSMQKNAWIHDGTGWFYMNGEGQYSTGWLTMTGLRYHLDDMSGRMDTGWKLLSGKWHYFATGGFLHTGWLADNGFRYYLEEDGTMAEGWKKLNDKWYFLEISSGCLISGWKNWNGQWYFLGDDGAMTCGWVKPDGCWYYLGNDGIMLSGWLDYQGNKYYLSTSSGKMSTGWREVGGVWYYFNGDGTMVRGMTQINGKEYYLNPDDGKLVVSSTFTLNGVSYTADGNGACVLTSLENAAQGAGQNAPQEPAGGNGAQGSSGSSGPGGEIGPGIR